MRSSSGSEFFHRHDADAARQNPIINRTTDESRYYTQKISQAPAVWELATEKKGTTFEMVAQTYGQWDLEVMDSFGGWTSTTQDLVRFIDAIDAENRRC